MDVTKEEIKQFLKDSIEWLVDQDMGCSTLKLDDRLAICVGWLDGYDENDEDLIHAKDGKSWCLNAGIKVYTSDDMRTDYEFINSPYYDNGEVVQTDVSLESNEDLDALADYFLKEYDNLKDLEIEEDGRIVEHSEDDFDDSYEDIDAEEEVDEEIVTIGKPKTIDRKYVIRNRDGRYIKNIRYIDFTNNVDDAVKFNTKEEATSTIERMKNSKQWRFFDSSDRPHLKVIKIDTPIKDEVKEESLKEDRQYLYDDKTKELAKKLVALAKKDGHTLSMDDACEVIDQSFNAKQSIEDFYKSLNWDGLKEESLKEDAKDVLSSKEFLAWHDNIENYRKFKSIFDKIYEIFENAGFNEDEDVDVCYDNLDDTDKIAITDMIRGCKSQDESLNESSGKHRFKYSIIDTNRDKLLDKSDEFSLLRDAVESLKKDFDLAITEWRVNPNSVKIKFYQDDKLVSETKNFDEFISFYNSYDPDELPESLKESWAGEDIIDDLVERATSMIDEGEDVDDAVRQAIDDGLIYTDDILELAKHYGTLPDDSDLLADFYDELSSDVYNGIEEHDEPEEDE